ncbi:hypothetical protein NDU88_005906 [Pleurodeles waltl]|uniref:Uncharacterized protein n=1 Tax=Pleurodeles waltl TaxID=8319 RepID=A0AAV7NSV5_PLEWA|nr:hypothetical protein NDU88_005906 [Pleurodeles waltl]
MRYSIRVLDSATPLTSLWLALSTYQISPASSTGSNQPNLGRYGMLAKQSIGTADEAISKRGQQANLVNPDPGNQLKTTTTPTSLAERGDPYEGGGITLKQLNPLFAGVAQAQRRSVRDHNPPAIPHYQ